MRGGGGPALLRQAVQETEMGIGWGGVLAMEMVRTDDRADCQVVVRSEEGWTEKRRERLCPLAWARIIPCEEDLIWKKEVRLSLGQGEI